MNFHRTAVVGAELIVGALVVLLLLASWQCGAEPCPGLAPCPNGDIETWANQCLAPGQCFHCPESEVTVCRP